MSNGYISPGEAWFRFLLWAFICIGSLGGILHLVLFGLRIWIDQQ